MNTQMEKYVATRTFDMAGVPVQKGMLIEFDGYNVKVGGRPQQPLPGFQGAIKTGWAVLQEAFDAGATPARPVSANIQVRPAKGGNPTERAQSSMIATSEAEEQIVGNVATHAANVQASNQQRRYMGTVEAQDGTPVRQLQTIADPRGRVRTELTTSSAHMAISAASNVQIKPGRGITRDEMMDRMSPDARQAYLAEIQARKASHGVLDQMVAVQGPDAQGQVVGRIRAPQDVDSLGFHVANSVGGGTETVDLTGLDGPPAETQVVEAEGMRFTTTNGPKKGVVTVQRAAGASPATDARRRIARAICGDFPDAYDFDLPLRKKLARLQADFEDRPDVIRAVAAAETDDEMRARLVEEFPEAFQAAP